MSDGSHCQVAMSEAHNGYGFGQAYATLCGAQLLLFIAIWLFMWPETLGVALPVQHTGAVAGAMVTLSALGMYVSLHRLFVGLPEVDGAGATA